MSSAEFSGGVPPSPMSCNAGSGGGAAYTHGKFSYKRRPKRVYFPEEEKVPESRHHAANRIALWQSAEAALPGRAAISSDQFLYWDPSDPDQNLAPDLMVRMGSTPAPDATWKTWESGHPELIVELISKSDRPKHKWAKKLRTLKQLGLREVVRFDRASKKAPLRVWDWCEDDLVERCLEDPLRAESAVLGLCFVVVGDGPERMLRLARDLEGRDILPTPEEARQAEEQARKAAEQAAKAAAQEAVAALLDLCEVLGVVVDAPQQAALVAMSPAELAGLRAHLKAHRAWPTPS